MIEKNQSPFSPGRPIPLDHLDSFVGRKKEFERVFRSVKEVERGKQKMIFLAGEYGIGKSSFANLVKAQAEKECHLLGIHVLLSGAQSVDDISRRTLEAVIQSPTHQPSLSDKIRRIFSSYIESVGIFGMSVKLKTDSIKTDTPSISAGFLPFLTGILDGLKEDGIKGIFLIFDDLNGITKKPEFAHFIKHLVDGNAVSNRPIPILLMLCGTEARRVEMIQNLQPIDRIFEIIDLEPVEKSEMESFFKKSFERAGHSIEQESLRLLCQHSEGFPKVMHLVGDCVYWSDKDGKIEVNDVREGLIDAAQQIGRQSIDEQVYRAIRSGDYRSILSKLALMEGIDLSFKKKDAEQRLSSPEKKKFNNFLQKMKTLEVLKKGDVGGEYIFTSRLTKLYLFMNSIERIQK